MFKFRSTNQAISCELQDLRIGCKSLQITKRSIKGHACTVELALLLGDGLWENNVNGMKTNLHSCTAEFPSSKARSP